MVSRLRLHPEQRVRTLGRPHDGRGVPQIGFNHVRVLPGGRVNTAGMTSKQHGRTPAWMSNRTTRDPTCPAGAVTTIFIHLPTMQDNAIGRAPRHILHSGMDAGRPSPSTKPYVTADQERTKSSVQLHFVIELSVSGQFLMAVDGQIPIPETASTRRRSPRLNDLDTRRRTAILAAPRKAPPREQRSQISPTKRALLINNWIRN